MGFQNVFGHKQKIGFAALSGPPAPVYGPYTIAFSAVVVSRGGVVTNAEKARLTTFENSLAADITEFDRLWIHGLSNNIAARTSFVNPTSLIASAVNNPTFTPNLGYTGDGISSYLNSNYNPRLDGINYTLNECGLFVYVQQNIYGLICAMGAYTAPFDVSVIYPQYVSGQGLYYLNNFSPDALMNQNSVGLSSIRRIDANIIESYKNGILNAADGRAVTSTPNTNIYIGGQSINGTFARGYYGTISASGIGSGNINQLNFYNSLQALATSLGWNV